MHSPVDDGEEMMEDMGSMGEPTMATANDEITPHIAEYSTVCFACKEQGIVDPCKHLIQDFDPILALPFDQPEGDDVLPPEKDPKVLARGARARAMREELRADREEYLTQKNKENKEKKLLEPPSNLSIRSERSSGALFKREDGTTVRSASRATAQKLWNKRGWTSHDDIRLEAQAYKEMLLANQGILDPSGSGKVILVNPENEEHVKAYAKQHNVSYFSKRDIANDPAPGYGEESIGRLVATDMINVDIERDIPALNTANQLEAKEGEKVPAQVGPRIPVNYMVWDQTEKEEMPDVERQLIFTQLTNVPVTTPRLLSLVTGVHIPVVMDSFSILRKYILLIRIVGCVWSFDRTKTDGYYETEEDICHIMSRVSIDNSWTSAITLSGENALKSGRKGISEPIYARRKDRKKKNKPHSVVTKRFDVWFTWLPEWFRNAMHSGRDTERWFRMEFAARKKRKLTEDQLEETMARFAWSQYALKKQHLTLEFMTKTNALKVKHHEGGVTNPNEIPDKDMFENVGFLTDLLECIYWMTREHIRAKEILLLRWNARYIPTDHWEWLMTPPNKPEPDMVIDRYKIPATVYRKELETTRAFILREDEDEFVQIQMEAAFDQVTRKSATILDNSPRSEYEGISLLSISRFFEFISFDSNGKEDIHEMVRRLNVAMENLKRMPEDRAFSYTPDREVIRPIVDKLDKTDVPNSMRPSYMETEHGAMIDAQNYHAGKFSSAANVRKVDPTEGVENTKSKTKRAHVEDDEVMGEQ